MNVLRENKESLMAVLEAFVYDPLINWRLMQTETEPPRAEGILSCGSSAPQLIRLHFYRLRRRSREGCGTCTRGRLSTRANPETKSRRE
jgi:phosphatidylinositol kinase/protein kinase (PI-3  family)